MLTISSRVDYAVRAALELAEADEPLTGVALAERQGLPLYFLREVLTSLRRGGVVHQERRRGYRLARPPAEITVADVIIAVEGSELVDVHGVPPEGTSYPGPATRLPEVWFALRSSVRGVTESVTLADLL